MIGLKPAFPFLEYAVNYDYISQVLCINKDRPEEQCFGKCYLMSAVKKEVENEGKDKAATVKFEHQLLFHQEVTANNPEVIATGDKKESFCQKQEHYSSLFIKTTFKPPISLA
ncbi:hypothetical protein DN748_03510 [Sinomicrobium soli]|nr:hypothetical protein DN748_03510 [Sinomicrobium sp. N-1-3-6]